MQVVLVVVATLPPRHSKPWVCFPASRHSYLVRLPTPLWPGRVAQQATAIRGRSAAPARLRGSRLELAEDADDPPPRVRMHRQHVDEVSAQSSPF